MNERDDERAGLDALSWDALAELYREAPPRREDAPSLPDAQDVHHGTGRRRERRALTLEVAAALVCVAAAFAGARDPLALTLAGAAAFVWLWAALASRRQQQASRDAAGQDAARFMHGESDRLTRTQRAWRLATLVLGLLSTLALGHVALALARASAPMSWVVSRELGWLLPGAWVSLLALIAIRRARRGARALTRHHELLETLELPMPGDLVGVPVGRAQIGVLATLLTIGLLSLAYARLVPDNPPDDPGRVLVVSDADDDFPGFLAAFDMRGDQLSRAEALERARAFAGADEDALSRLMALADHRGYGFLIVDLGDAPVTTEALPRRTWLHGRAYTLDTRDPAPGERFAAVNIGDLTIHGHHVTYGVEPPRLERPRPRGRVALMRALFAQPGFRDPPMEDPRWEFRHDVLDAAVAAGLRPHLLLEAVGKAESIDVGLEHGVIAPELRTRETE